jgi:hypothetical protein
MFNTENHASQNLLEALKVKDIDFGIIFYKY